MYFFGGMDRSLIQCILYITMVRKSYSEVFKNLKKGIKILAAFACPASLPVALSGIFHPSAAAAHAHADGDAEKSCRQQK